MIVTKGGLVRPDGMWHPNGRAKHLADGRAREPRQARPDRSVPLARGRSEDADRDERARARAAARCRRRARHRRRQRDAAPARSRARGRADRRRRDRAVAEQARRACTAGWSRRARRAGSACSRIVRSAARAARRGWRAIRCSRRSRRGSAPTPAEIALAWLRELSPMIATLPGATRVDTARSCARDVALDAEAMRGSSPRTGSTLEADARAAHAEARGREVVMIVGMPGAGKSTATADYAARGYDVLNRDARGGSIADLARELDRRLAAGSERVVLDNTYGTRSTRAPVIRIARAARPARCAASVLTTSLEDAQHNGAARELADPSRRGAAERAVSLPAHVRAAARRRGLRRDPRAAVRAHARAGCARGAHRRARRRDLARPADLARGDRAARADARAQLDAWRARGYAIAGTTWQPTAPAIAPLAARARRARRARSRSPRARIPRGRRSAGVASRCPVSGCCSRAIATSISRASAPRRRAARRSRLRAAPRRAVRERGRPDGIRPDPHRRRARTARSSPCARGSRRRRCAGPCAARAAGSTWSR